jgi:hypothetical protein
MGEGMAQQLRGLRNWIPQSLLMSLVVLALCAAFVGIPKAADGNTAKSTNSADRGRPTVRVPVIACSTTVPPEKLNDHRLGSSGPLSLSRGLREKVALYSAGPGLEILAPSNWLCLANPLESASYVSGARGVSGEMAILPRATNPGPGSVLAPATGLTEGLALLASPDGGYPSLGCSLLPSEAARWRSIAGGPCPSQSARQVERNISKDIVSFTDPPGVRGASLNGGTDRWTFSVMAYSGGDYGNMDIASCSLPTSDRDLCSASLRQYTDSVHTTLGIMEHPRGIGSPTLQPLRKPEHVGRPATSTSTLKIQVPEVTCSTQVPSDGSSTPPKPLPTKASLAIPPSLAGSVSLYSDTIGVMQILGPTGWSCEAQYGADLSGGLALYPAGSPPPPSEAQYWTNTAVPPPGATESIVGNQTSACSGCGLGQACPLFLAATYSDFSSGFLGNCSRPLKESDRALSKTAIAFWDPPGVRGVGIGSGGSNSTTGVMTYDVDSSLGSWLEACTLPASEVAICSASTQLFTQDYGSR